LRCYRHNKKNINDTTDSTELNPTIRLLVGPGIIGTSPSPASQANVMGSVGDELIFQDKFYVISFRYIVSESNNAPFPTPNLKDFGILCGVGLHGPAGLVSAGVGIEYLDRNWPVYFSPATELIRTQADSNATVHTHTFGFSYQLQATWNIIHGIGLGAIVYWNTNRDL
jgi:hypothetical protein